MVLAKNPIYHERSKHINICLHFIREYAKKKNVELTYVMSHDQVNDIFTKLLVADPFSQAQESSWNER